MDEDAVKWIHDPTPSVTLHGLLSLKMHQCFFRRCKRGASKIPLDICRSLCSVVFTQLCSQLSDETATSGVRGYEFRNDYQDCIVISTGSMQSLTVVYSSFV